MQPWELLADLLLVNISNIMNATVIHFEWRMALSETLPGNTLATTEPIRIT